MVFYNSKLAKLLLWSGYDTITLGFIILTTRKTWEMNQEVLNHEKIHVAQWMEVTKFFMLIWVVVSLMLGSVKMLWWLPVNMFAYYLIYMVEYAIRRLYGGETGKQDYRNIEFEKEAYKHQRDFGYLEERKPFAWLFDKWIV